MNRVMLRLLATFLLTLGGSAIASTQSLWSVEQLVDRCDRMGVVRCVTGGRLVASFEIVEAWKGGGLGETITIGFSNPQFLGDRPPFMLAGEEYVIAAWRNGSKPFPGWVRCGYIGGRALASVNPAAELGRLAPDFLVNPDVGLAPLRTSRSNSSAKRDGRRASDVSTFASWIREAATDPLAFAAAFPALRSGRRGLAALRARVHHHLSLDEEARERLLLHQHIAPLLRSSGANDVLEVLDSTTAVDDYLSRLIFVPIKRYSRDTWARIGGILAVAGGRRTLEFALREPFVPNSFTVLTTLKERLADVDFEPRHEKEARARASYEVDLVPSRWVELLPGSPHPEFEWVTRFAVPDLIVNALLGFEEGTPSAGIDAPGFRLISEFARIHPGVKRLERLTRARDPWIRAGAAVHLSLVDQELGSAKLHEALTIPGDPGAWAGLALASRGDRVGLERALRIVEDPGVAEIRRSVHEALVDRLLVLLSNSAFTAGVPIPDSWYVRGVPGDLRPPQRDLRDIAVWWRTNAARLELRDPWFAILSVRGIDG